MYSKITAVTVLLALAYGQEYHHHGYLQTHHHETPHKVANHHHLYHSMPVPVTPTHNIHSAPQSQGHALSSQSITLHGSHNSYEESHGSQGSHIESQGFHIESRAKPLQYFGHSSFGPRDPAPVHEFGLHSAPTTPFIQPKPAPIFVQQPHQKESQHEPSQSHHEAVHHEDSFAYPKYEYQYKIEDPHTGDKKSLHEHRDGDVVKGEYSFHDSDGSIRTVKYTADHKHGFQAMVSHTAIHEAQPHH